ncbi:MAG: patatin-like phospholipase family protein [Chitinophagales bacterium]
MKKYYQIISLIVNIYLFSACSSQIVPDRDIFIKDGETAPTIKLHKYKSVQERPNQNPNLAVALAISGGGSRASNFGIGVMLGLEQIIQENGNNVLQEIDYLSTVSGGGFAGGAYINSLFEHYYTKNDKKYELNQYVNQRIKEDLEHSFMGSVLKNYLNPKIWFTFADDGDILERTIDNTVLGYKRHKTNANLREMPQRSITLGDLFVAKTDTSHKVLFPMMFANGAIMGKMAIFPFSPDILHTYQINGVTHRLKKIHPIDPYDVPLSVGIKASGSFPVLISNTTLISRYNPKFKYLHIVDGGLADNYGYQTALDILKQDKVAQKKVMLIIDANNDGMTKTFSKVQSGTNMFKVFATLPYSGLSAKTATLKPEVFAESSVVEVEPIFLSFNVLLDNNEVLPPEKIDVKKEQKRLIYQLTTNMNNISKKDLQILYELLTNVGTKYTITQDEQDLLLLAGQKIVLMQKDNILGVLKGKESEDKEEEE